MTTEIVSPMRSYILAEHQRAEIERLNRGLSGCGCRGCQELYKTIDVSKYGHRVTFNGDTINITDAPWLQQVKDRWQGDIRIVGGKKYIVNKQGRTVCQGENGPAVISDIVDLRLIKVIPNPAETCPGYEGCKSPLCPMDDQTIKNGIWYPDEDICSRRGMKVPWVKTQRKVAKRAKNPEFYFSISDLVAMKRVVRPLGHDPDVLTTDSNKKTINNMPGEKSVGHTTINDKGRQGSLAL